MNNNLNPKETGLIVVDYQNDFSDKKGSLYVTGSEKLVKTINELVKVFQQNDLLRIATKDWHPQKHISFASRFNIPAYSNFENETKWPDHCVQDTWGAELVDGIKADDFNKIILKGNNQDKDAYSGFADTDLNDYLKENQIKNLYITGVATDYCVKATALDAVKLNYNTYVVTDAIKEVFPDNKDKEIKIMKNENVKFITSLELFKNLN